MYKRQAYNGVLDVPVEEQLKYYDDWGSATTYPHMAVGWSWAFDTPFKYTCLLYTSRCV